MNRYMLIDFENKSIMSLNKVDIDLPENDKFCGSVTCTDYNDLVMTIIDELPSEMVDENNLMYYDFMVKTIDNLIVKLWKEYDTSDLNKIIMGLVYYFEPYGIQSQYIDYLIEELQDLKENK